MSSKEEGFVPNRPPFFYGTDYANWKSHMIIYLRSLDSRVWSAIEKGYTKPKDKSEAEWDTNEKMAYTANYRTLNAIVCGLSQEEYNRVSSLLTAKEVWYLIEVTHEGTNLVKQYKL